MSEQGHESLDLLGAELATVGDAEFQNAPGPEDSIFPVEDTNADQEPESWTESLVGRIEGDGSKEQIASMYASAYVSSQSVRWRAVNDAIIERWSKSGLQDIKHKAWELLTA